ncbi:MAG: hypothetical protein ACOX47_06075 [Bacillota bacterium]
MNKASGNITYEGKYIKLTQDILLNEMNPDGTFKSGSPRAVSQYWQSKQTLCRGI